MPAAYVRGQGLEIQKGDYSRELRRYKTAQSLATSPQL